MSEEEHKDKAKIICMNTLSCATGTIFRTSFRYNSFDNTFNIAQERQFIEIDMDEAKEIAKMIMEYIGEDYEQITEN